MSGLEKIKRKKLMIKVIFYQIVIFFSLIFCINAYAIDTYQWYEAHEHIGETAIIEGIITYTNNIGNICFLNFHPNFEEYISIVIYDENFPLFPKSPEIHYYLKQVRVHGLITTYNEKAQIVINNTDQIEVVGEYQRQEDFPPCKCNYPEQLEITAINVGQGDSTLIATPSKIMLADAGESFWHSNEDAIKIDSVIRSKYGEDCRCIDYVLISHFHLDHIGYVFLPETVDDFPLNSDLEKLELGDNAYKPLGYGGLAYLVLERGYQIGKMLVRDYKKHNPNKLSEDGGSKTFRNWKIILESLEGKNWFHPEIIRLGQDQINLDTIGKIPIIVDVVVMDGATTSNVNGCNPIKYFGGDDIRGDHSSDTFPPSENDFSVGFVLSFNEFQMFIGGDLSGENYESDFGYKYHDVETCLAEDPYIAKEYAHQLEVLRVNHHGSSHSTNQRFVDVFDPKIAIFSVGDHNTYEHVNKVILDRILDKVIGDNDGKVLMTECGDNVMSPTEVCHSTKNNLCAEIVDNEFPVGLESDEIQDANIEISVSLDGKSYFVQGINYSTIRPGDINGIKGVKLSDAILVFQLLSGLQLSINPQLEADINKDNKIFLEETLYILQEISGLR